MTDLPRDRDLCSRRMMLLADGHKFRVGGDGVVPFHQFARAEGTEHRHQDVMLLTELDEVYIGN